MTINRRKFLKFSAFTAALAALAACAPTRSPALLATPGGSVAPTVSAAATATAAGTVVTPTVAATQTATPEDVLIPRMLRRILFAATPEDLAHARQIGLDAFIEEQLAPHILPDPEVEPRLAAYETLGMDALQLAQVTPRQKPGQQLAQATLVRAVFSRRQLYELMVDFWSNHFNIYLAKGVDRYLKTIDDREVIRPNALGKFSDLLSASAHSPAMLIYLDNALSNRRAPNENYARELMELHTLGVDGGYTQEDVHEVARALTGWTVSGARSQEAGAFLFDAKSHDDGTKMILGHSFPAGQGIKDGEQLLDMLASSPATAQFICRKLVQRFVSDAPPVALVASAAAAFSKTGGDIPAVMSVILHSAEFKASLGSKIKRPFEFIASTLRASGAAFQPDLPSLGILRNMGQPLFGWESPNGFPDAAPAWITTTGVLNRWNYALAIAFNTLKDTHLDPSTWITEPANIPEGIDALSKRLLGETLPEAERNIILSFAGNSPFSALAPALVALILSTPDFCYR